MSTQTGELRRPGPRPVIKPRVSAPELGTHLVLVAAPSKVMARARLAEPPPSACSSPFNDPDWRAEKNPRLPVNPTLRLRLFFAVGT